MEDKILNILIFPCGSEIGLELYRSLAFSRQFHLVGANSTDDHGRFVYEDYIGDLPFIDDDQFIEKIREIIETRNIDILYPTMDTVIAKITSFANDLPCLIVGSPAETNLLLLSKSNTYDKLAGLVPIPRIFRCLSEIDNYPVFIKPDVGYGSRGAKRVFSLAEAEIHLNTLDNHVIMESLPGNEFTVDCFTSGNGQLIFCKPRGRERIMNGISVHTSNLVVADRIDEFRKYGEKINHHLFLRGSWFFQMKENGNGEPKLLEVGSRLAGSSSLYRAMGINFALLNVWQAMGKEVDIIENKQAIQADRALDVRYKIDIQYNTIYVDLDDTLLLRDGVNYLLVSFLYKSLNMGHRLVLITKHKKNLASTLGKWRLSNIFDEIIQIEEGQQKTDFLKEKKAIFIDDSFQERKNVLEKIGIPVFAPDAVEALF